MTQKKLNKLKEKKKEKLELQTKSPTQVFEPELMSQVEEKLRLQIHDLENALTQALLISKIAEDKLTLWVRKHDELLIRYKELLKNNELNAQ